jgi:hypothetical protein
MVVYVGVPHGRDTAHTLRLLAHWLDPSARVMALYCGVPAEPHANDGGGPALSRSWRA